MESCPFFYQTLKEELISILLKLLQEIEKKGTLLNTFYEVSIEKPRKVVTRKENYRLISSINIVQRFSTNYCQTEFNKTSKRTYTMTKSVSTQECKCGSIYINQ
jgi:hypothetical protein